MGVGTTPCGVWIFPARAPVSGQMASISNRNLIVSQTGPAECSLGPVVCAGLSLPLRAEWDTIKAMPGPPPLPSTRQKIPGWVWGLIALGVVMGLTSVGLIGGLFWIGQKSAQGTMLLAERPKRCVRMATNPDEELSVGTNGEYRYKHKKTGQVRVIWVEGDKAPEPTWLNVPEDAEQLSGSGVRAGGRREAAFEYDLKGPMAEAHEAFRQQLATLGFTVRSAKIEGFSHLVYIVNGQDATREAFVSVAQRENGGATLRVRITEPAAQ